QSLAGTVFIVDFYANTTGKGARQTYLGSATYTTDSSSGLVNFLNGLLPSLLPSVTISATATDPSGNTSEFSNFQGQAGYHDIPPAVAISGSSLGVAGTKVSFQSTITPDPSDPDTTKTYTYAWSVTLAGNLAYTVPDGTVIDEAAFVFTPAAAGTYL